MDLTKFTIVIEWPIQKNKFEVKSFVGLASYYRIFVRLFSKITVFLSNMLKEKNIVKD
jgi:hypothetical protein